MRFGSKFRPGERVSTWTEFGGRRGIVATGASSDTISGGYRIIQFNSNGKLDVYDKPVNIEYLVVGGGGAGRLGGGGAGGYASNVGGSPLTLSVGTHDIVVGAGGVGDNGEASKLGGYVTCAGGGMGGATSTDVTAARGHGGSSGGGGGGAVSAISATHPGGNALTSSLGIGNVGGIGRQPTSGSPTGGGGGGSGSAGSAWNVNTGAGGSGTANSITGSSVTYAAGGNGGTSDGSAGGANTGNGGGKNANGGSGVVIIRYAV